MLTPHSSYIGQRVLELFSGTLPPMVVTAASGAPVKLVSARLGHATPGFTLSVYRHLYDAERKQAALSLDELLGNVPRVVN